MWCMATDRHTRIGQKHSPAESSQQFQFTIPELPQGWMQSAEDMQSNGEDLHDAAVYCPRTGDLFAEVLQGELGKAVQNPR